MDLASVWRSRKAGKKKSAHKPKIRWQLLGLTDPNSVDSISSIEVIRREVASLARHSFGEDTRLRTIVQESKSLDRSHTLVGARNKRRGASKQTQDGA